MQSTKTASVHDAAPAQPGVRAAGLHRFAVATAAATFVLIFVGALVTSTGSALAVPDWPLSFGKFFPRMEGGVLYEHGHRMVAGTVTILTLILMLWTWRSESRRWVRYAAAAAFGLIVVQAVLGGLTVLLLLPLPIAVAHAATAQAFFCLMVALAIFTSSRWEREPEQIGGDRRRPSLPALAAVTTLAIYVQILIGAVMRHMGAGLVIPDFPLSFGHIVPRFDSDLFALVAINYAHRCGALVVTGLVVWTVVRVLRAHRGESWLRRPALALKSAANRADLPRRHHGMEWQIGDSDHGPRRNRGRGARHQPDADAARVSTAAPLAGIAIFDGRERHAGQPGRRSSGDGMSGGVLTIAAGAAQVRTRAADYLALTKPRVVGMVLVTTLVGFYLASGGDFDASLALKAAARYRARSRRHAGAQSIYRARFRRADASHPHASVARRRLRPGQALAFGLTATVSGFAILALEVNLLSASVVLATTLTYLFAYTPLKRVSWVCNLVGAIPGALPPVAGWAAARGTIGAEAGLLFAIMCLWQLPHSLAIARLYRADYARAGIRLLPDEDQRGNPTGALIVGTCIALLVAGALPTLMGFAGVAYLAVAGSLGLGFLFFALRLKSAPAMAAAARHVVLASVVYLPVVLLVLALDRV